MLKDLSDNSFSTTPRVYLAELCTGKVVFFLSRIKTTSSFEMGPTDRLNFPNDTSDLVINTWKVFLNASILS